MQCNSFCPITFSTAPTCWVCGHNGRCNKKTAASAANTDNGKAVNENSTSKTASMLTNVKENFKYE